MIPLYDPFDANGNIIANALARPRLQCNGVLNVICPGRISPIAKAVQSVLPAANDPDQPTDTSKITNNAVSYSSSESRARVPSIKGDYVISDKQRVSFMHGRSWSPAQPCISAIKGVPCNSWPSDQSTKYYRLNHDYILTPNLLNHVTIGFNTRFVIENPDNINGLNDDWRKAIQIPGTTRGGKPGKGTEYNTEYFRTPVRVDTDSRQRTTSIKEQVAWLQGKHSVKFGFDYIRNFYRRSGLRRLRRQHQFQPVGDREPGSQRAHRRRLRRLPPRRGRFQQFQLQRGHRIPDALLRLVCSGRFQGDAGN